MHTADMAPGPDPSTEGGQPSSAWQRVQTLGVAQIVVLILEARKTMPWATAATVSRERQGGTFRVRVSLLKCGPSAATENPGDHGDSGAVGRVIADFAVNRLDQDLADAFGDHNVITLK
jgi:hypothetical protein